MATQLGIPSIQFLPRFLPKCRSNRHKIGLRIRSKLGEDEYLIDAPVSAGDGFSFTGGKYSDGPSPSDEWRAQGKFVKAHPVYGYNGKAKDPIFGLTMGSGSQSSTDVFRWFCVESGSSSNPSVVLAHGFPSQAYSYRKVLPVLSQSYHATAFDWLGFGFSDKPQPKYGFDYTLDEYTAAFESLIEAIAPDKFSLVIQITDKHAILPSTLALFSNFLLGEIFSQDPLRASDKALMSSGPYAMKEEVAMVYRRPYLTSGSSGFALNAISRAMKKDLKAYVQSMREVLLSESWKVPTSICWGMRDRWLSYEGVEDFCKVSNKKLLELPMAGHHVQEDFGEELGRIISEIIK
ncbi:alpha/beta-Hydrolases superfamily protein isoform X5 [Carex rostrata]